MQQSRQDNASDIEESIRQALCKLRDDGYVRFQAKLIPTIPADTILGVRMPALRLFAKELAQSSEAEVFLNCLPHKYYDENNLHALLINRMTQSIEGAFCALDTFLPYVDNWATCDALDPRPFRCASDVVFSKACAWIGIDTASTEMHPATPDARITAISVYQVRFGINCLRKYFLGDAFSPALLQAAAQVESGEYYIDMARAWFFAEALIKRYDATIPLFTTPTLDVWTHNKALQKARESHRVSPEQKLYFTSLKRRV